MKTIGNFPLDSKSQHRS